MPYLADISLLLNILVYPENTGFQIIVQNNFQYYFYLV